MIKKRKSVFILAAFLLAAALPAFSQEEEEDEKKMIREVIDVQVDRPPVVAAPAPVETPGKKGKKKKHQDPPPEETAPVDSGGTIPAPIPELMKRGNAWMTKKNKDFLKVDPTSSGNTLECLVSFAYKPKELNPGAPVEGKVTMKVIIDCKEGKYRYTIKDIVHTANDADFCGGDVFETIPKCGSMSLPEPSWKKIKSFALAKANIVAGDLKETMKKKVNEKKAT
jgi:hypothetical protein